MIEFNKYKICFVFYIIGSLLFQKLKISESSTKIVCVENFLSFRVLATRCQTCMIKKQWGYSAHMRYSEKYNYYILKEKPRRGGRERWGEMKREREWMLDNDGKGKEESDILYFISKGGRIQQEIQKDIASFLIASLLSLVKSFLQDVKSFTFLILSMIESSACSTRGHP